LGFGADMRIKVMGLREIKLEDLFWNHLIQDTVKSALVNTVISLWFIKGS
jgi:hypothetical protein